MRFVGRAAAGAVGLFNLAVLAGWYSGLISPSATLLPGIALMRPETALAFILLAIGTGLRPPNAAGRVAAGLATVLGIMALVEFATAAPLALLSWLPNVLVPAQSASMAPATAVAVIMMGIAVLARRKTLSKLTQGLAVASFCLTQLALITFVYGVAVAPEVATFRNMTVPTGVSVALLVLCILLQYPTEGLMGLLRDEGGAGRLLRPMVPAMFVLPFALGAVLLWGEANGVFSIAAGVATCVMAMTLLGCGLMWRAALRLRQLDRFRDEAAGRLSEANQLLEVVVAERTAELAASTAKLVALIRLAPVGIVQLGPGGAVLTTNEQWCLLAGITEEAAKRDGWFAAVHPDDREQVETQWAAQIPAGIGFNTTMRFRRPDGQVSWVQVNTAPIVKDGQVRGVISTVTDVTALRDAEASALAAQELFVAAFASSPFGTAVVSDRGFVLAANDRFAGLSGRSAELLRGHSIDDIFMTDGVTESVPPVVPRDERRLRRPDGADIWVTVNAAPILGEGNFGSMLYQLEDITARRIAESRVEHLAFHDPLTGLPNRLLLIDRIRQALLLATRQGTTVGLLYMDLDGFKRVNDTLGHPAGDAVLIEVASRLRTHCRETDTVSRLGGDEFVLVIPGLGDRAEVMKIAETITRIIARPISFGAQTTAVGASVGIAFGEGRDDPETLLRNADQAMYQAKENGRGRYEVFDEDLRGQIERRYDTERALRNAVEQGEIETWYQPIVALDSLEVVAAEALARWRRPVQGLVFPGDFISVAEEAGLIEGIGGEVLRQACLTAVAIENGPAVSVNVSTHQFAQDDFGAVVQGALRSSGLPADRLWLELTESSAIDATGFAARTFQSVREMGVHVAIDDFGTGYSSFAHLRTLTVDTLKISMTFIQDLERSTKDRAVVAGMVRMADSLRLRVVAEGITTAKQRDVLLSMGCPLGQGALFSPPKPMIPDRVLGAHGSPSGTVY